MKHSKWLWLTKLPALVVVMLLTMLSLAPVSAGHLVGTSATYTLDADFDEGAKINVDHFVANQLQLDDTPTTLPFIWIAASGRGTIVKIDTATGAILGEYKSAPDGRGRNPSRTTVDANGNVWAGNRDESSGGQGSVVHVGLEENSQCVDRNVNGIIDTSTGLGDIRPWLNTGGADDAGGVSTADDECIIHYVRVSGDNTRHVSVDANNNVWTAGNFGADNSFDLVSPTGTILASTGDLPCGGYGGLVDSNGVLWSANRGPGAVSLLRYDTNNTITTVDDSFACLDAPNSYGLGMDSVGNIWHSQWTSNFIRKYSPAGAVLADFGTGGSCSRGVAVTADDNIWVANSCSNTVTRLSNAGALLATVPVGAHPTGVSVDAAGKVWATNFSSDDASRIDPATNTVDLTVGLGAGATPYNYSDMTGSTLIAPPNTGTWTVTQDSGAAATEWGTVTWNDEPEGATPGDSSLTVEARSSEDNATWTAFESVSYGVDLTVPDGRYLQVRVTFKRSTTTDSDGDGIGDSPVLSDLSIVANRPPNCSAAAPSVSELWPPNHQYVDIAILGVTDPDGDPISITITSIWQDEPVNTVADGNTSPDGTGVGTSTASVRAERAGSPKVPGNGRVYHIGFTASDGLETCSGSVLVGVPHDQGKGKPAVDDGALYDSTIP